MRKTLTILLLVILTFSHLGYYCIYCYQQQQIKEEMEIALFKTISDEDLEVFEFTENNTDIIWQDKGREFSLHGELYDVAKIKTIDGKVFLYCINDKKEEQLLHAYSKAVNSNIDSGKSGKNGFNFQLSDFINISIEKKTPPVLFINKGFIILVLLLLLLQKK